MKKPFAKTGEGKAIIISIICMIFIGLLIILSSYLIDVLAAKSSFFLYAKPANSNKTKFLDNSGMYVNEDFPSIPFQSQYGTITIPDAKIDKVPVFYGDTEEVLLKGIGHFAGSRFPGQNGNIVMSGHVTTCCRYLEDLKPGAKVTINTDYGDFVYEMEKSIIFDREDSSALMPTDGKEQLTLYTCYPYDNGGKLRTDRIAIVCKKVSGALWVNQNSVNGTW